MIDRCISWYTYLNDRTNEILPIRNTSLETLENFKLIQEPSIRDVYRGQGYCSRLVPFLMKVDEKITMGDFLTYY